MNKHNDTQETGRTDRLVMPDDALIRVVGIAYHTGSTRKQDTKALAGAVSYLMNQINVLANTFDPDGDEGIKDHVNEVREHANSILIKIIET